MAKTKEELNQLKEEYKTLIAKLKELSNDELAEVTGGFAYDLFEKLEGKTGQDVTKPKSEGIHIPGLDIIGPYVVGGIPLDSDSKLKK